MEENIKKPEINMVEKKPIAEKLQPIAIPFATFIAGIAVASSFFIFFNNSAKTTQNLSLDKVTKNDHIIGNLEAKVTIVEYSDTECPFCKMFQGTMQRISSEYDDNDVAWVYRHFPLPIHSKASKEAEATECAAKLGGNDKFWQYIDRLFAITPANNGLDESLLFKIAEEVGLDTNAFKNCLASDEMKSAVNKGLESGTKAGANGTPYSLIVVKGKVVDVINGAQPYEIVKQQIDQTLK